MLNFLRPSSSAPAMTVQEAIAKLKAGEITVIDVREAGEIAQTGKAKGALHIPSALVPVKADPKAPDCTVPQGKPVACYCASGMRSGNAVAVLKRLGYEAYNIGTIRDWAAAGGQISR